MKKALWILVMALATASLLQAAAMTKASGAGYAYLVIVAHPDDETAYLSPGVLQLGTEQGLKGAIFVLTSGEKGGGRGGWEMDDALAARREAEMLKAAEAYRLDLLLGGFRDYGEERTPDQVFQDAWDWDESLKLTVKVIRELKPGILISQDPDKAPGSPAHRASGRLAAEAFRLAADEKFHPELGRAWRCARHLSSAEDEDKGGYVIKAGGHAEQVRAAQLAHASQAAERFALSVKPQRFTWQQGQGPESGESLSQGIEASLLPPLTTKKFKPALRRLYKEKQGAALRVIQHKRWERFINELPSYQFRYSKPAVMARLKKIPEIDGTLDAVDGGQALELSSKAFSEASGRLQLGWTPQGLYVALDVRKKGPAMNTAENGEYWGGDALELFLNPHPEDAAAKRVWRGTRDRQILLVPVTREGGAKAVGCSVGTFALEGAKVAAVSRKDGYTLEAFIPAKNYTRWGFKPGDRLRFDAALDIQLKGGGRRQIVWHDTSKNTWFNPDGWGLAEIQ